ncbi:hypothetical protein [Longirhabdus pacifica]|uniref:hypothetical protein n=1 Tax=Longirhabdus pacifica TaxID=2305227 RepID=UPI001009268D|nr:hypothetical protein [Longirhabdus pacifica]
MFPYEVEYSNVEIYFDRRRIHQFIAALMDDKYTVYWNETDDEFSLIIVKTKVITKLKFKRKEHQYKMDGNYSFKDNTLAKMVEKLIEDSKGHAIVKRFHEHQVKIDNILFGEVIRTVKISDVSLNKEKKAVVTMNDVLQAWQCNRIQERIKFIYLEIDEQLLLLHKYLERNELTLIEQCKQKLKALQHEMFTMELF